MTTMILLAAMLVMISLHLLAPGKMIIPRRWNLLWVVPLGLGVAIHRGAHPKPLTWSTLQVVNLRLW